MIHRTQVTLQRLVEFGQGKEVSHQEDQDLYSLVVFTDGSAVGVETAFRFKNPPICYIFPTYMKDVMNETLIAEQRRSTEELL